MMDVNAIAIVGCGLMGCDVAALFLAAGWHVRAVSPSLQGARRAAIDAALRQLAGSLGAALASESPLGSSSSSKSLQLVANLADLNWTDVRLVLEAVPEDFAAKRAVFAQLDSLVPPLVPVATNSSSLRISEIARDCTTRMRMAGLHFFFPAHLVPLVEVVRGECTDDATLEQLYDIIETVGHVPVRVKRDVPGFLANRIQHALMREVFALLDAGLSTPDEIDKVVRFGFGFRYVAAGPLLQKEFAGLDTQLAAARRIYPSLDNSVEPSRTLTQLVERGQVGVKAGRGFWDWTPESAAIEKARYERVLLATRALMRAEQVTPRAY
jgi:3-hydroxybutyryl-CoA dehydrogenase